ncbi:MAG TPA: hypothetical protein VMU02_12100 [bacterium]|nr:hypothetical protein [bacterium]
MTGGRAWSSRAQTVIGVVAVVVILLASGASAGIPREIAYQGRLTDTGGTPLAGDHSVTFSLHSAESGGNLLWSEAKTVTADSDGVFTTILGSMTPIEISFAEPRWLAITVDGHPLSPRREIVSVASAFNALDADSLGGAAASSYSLTGHSHSFLDAPGGSPGQVLIADANANVGIGTQTPAYRLHVETSASSSGTRAIYGLASHAGTGRQLCGVYGETRSTDVDNPGSGVFGWANAQTGRGEGVTGESAAETGTGVYGWAYHTSGINYGVYAKTSSSNGFAGYFVGSKNFFDGKIGIGSQYPTARLDIYGTTGYNQVRMETSFTPTGTADARGSTGDVAWDDSYIYIKTSGGWKRAALSTW